MWQFEPVNILLSPWPTSLINVSSLLTHPVPSFSLDHASRTPLPGDKVKGEGCATAEVVWN